MAKIKVSKFVKTANGIVPLGEDGKQIGAKALLQSGNIEYNLKVGTLSLLKTKAGKTVYYDGTKLDHIDNITKDITKDVKVLKTKSKPAVADNKEVKAGKIKVTSAPYTLVRVHKNKTDKGLLKDYKYILVEKATNKEIELLRGNVEKFFENPKWDKKDRSKRLLGGSGALVDGLIENYYAKDDTWHLRVNKNAEVVVDSNAVNNVGESDTYTLTDVWARTSVSDAGKHKLEKYAYGLTNNRTKETDVYTRDLLFNLFLNKSGTGETLYDTKRLKNATLQYYKNEKGSESWRVRVQESKVNWHVDEVGNVAVNAISYFCSKVYCVKVPDSKGGTINQYVEFEVVPLSESDIEGLKGGDYTVDEMFSSYSMIVTGADLVALAEKPDAKEYPFYDSLKFDNLYIKNVYGKDNQDRQAEIVVYKQDEMPKRSITQYVPEVVELDYDTWKKSHQAHVDKIEKFVKDKEEKADSILIDWETVVKQPIDSEDIKGTNITLADFWANRNCNKIRFNTLPLDSDNITEISVMYDMTRVSDDTYMVSEARTKGSMRSTTAKKFTLVGEVPNKSSDELGRDLVRFISCVANELNKRLVLIVGVADTKRFVITCTDTVTQKKIVNNQTVFYVPVVWTETFEAIVKAENTHQARKYAEQRLDKIRNMPSKEYRQKTGDYEVKEISTNYRKSAEVSPSELYARMDKEIEENEATNNSTSTVAHDGGKVVVTQLKTHKTLNTYKCKVEVTMYTFVPITAESEQEAFGVKLQEAIKAGVIDSCEARSLFGTVDVKSCVLVDDSLSESISDGQRELEAWNSLDATEIPLDYNGEVVGAVGEETDSIENTPNYLDIIDWLLQMNKFSIDLLNENEVLMLGENQEHKLTTKQFNYAFDLTELDTIKDISGKDDNKPFIVWYNALRMIVKEGSLYNNIIEALGSESELVKNFKQGLDYQELFNVTMNFAGSHYIATLFLLSDLRLVAEVDAETMKCDFLTLSGEGKNLSIMLKDKIYDCVHDKLKVLYSNLTDGSDKLNESIEGIKNAFVDYIDVRVNANTGTVYKTLTSNISLYNVLTNGFILFYHKQGTDATKQLYGLNKKKITLNELLSNIIFKRKYKTLDTVRTVGDVITSQDDLYNALLKNGIEFDERVSSLSVSDVKSVLLGKDYMIDLDLSDTMSGQEEDVDILKVLEEADNIIDIPNVFENSRITLTDTVTVNLDDLKKAVGLGSDDLLNYVVYIHDMINDNSVFMSELTAITQKVYQSEEWKTLEAIVANYGSGDATRKAVHVLGDLAKFEVTDYSQRITSADTVCEILGDSKLHISMHSKEICKALKTVQSLDTYIKNILSYADGNTENGKELYSSYSTFMSKYNVILGSKLKKSENITIINKNTNEYKEAASQGLFDKDYLFFELMQEGHKPRLCAVKLNNMTVTLWCENIKFESNDTIDIKPSDDVIYVGQENIYDAFDITIDGVATGEPVATTVTLKLNSSDTISSALNIFNGMIVDEVRKLANISDDILEIIGEAAKSEFIKLDNTYNLSVDIRDDLYACLRSEIVTLFASYSFDYTSLINTKEYSLTAKITVFDTKGVNKNKNYSDRLKDSFIESLSQYIDNLINYLMDMHTANKQKKEEAMNAGVSGSAFLSEKPASTDVSSTAKIRTEDLSDEDSPYFVAYCNFALKATGGYDGLKITNEATFLDSNTVYKLLEDNALINMIKDKLGDTYTVRVYGNDHFEILRTMVIYDNKKVTYNINVSSSGIHVCLSLDSMKTFRYGEFAQFLKDSDTTVYNVLAEAINQASSEDTGIDWSNLGQLDLDLDLEAETSEPVGQDDIDEAMSQFNMEDFGTDEDSESDEDEFMAMFNSLETIDTTDSQAQTSIALDTEDIEDAASLFDGEIELGDMGSNEDVLQETFDRLVSVLLKHFSDKTTHNYKLDSTGDKFIFEDNDTIYSGKDAIVELRKLGIEYPCKIYPYFDMIFEKLESIEGSTELDTVGMDIMGLQEYYDKYGDNFINKTCSIKPKVTKEVEEEIAKLLDDVGIKASNFNFLKGVNRM